MGRCLFSTKKANLGDGLSNLIYPTVGALIAFIAFQRFHLING